MNALLILALFAQAPQSFAGAFYDTPLPQVAQADVVKRGIGEHARKVQPDDLPVGVCEFGCSCGHNPCDCPTCPGNKVKQPGVPSDVPANPPPASTAAAVKAGPPAAVVTIQADPAGPSEQPRWLRVVPDQAHPDGWRFGYARNGWVYDAATAAVPQLARPAQGLSLPAPGGFYTVQGGCANGQCGTVQVRRGLFGRRR